MITRLVARQLRHPSGWGGRLIARLMNRVNRPLHQAAAEALALRPEHRVLEVGFGGGTLLRALLAGTTDGRVAGLELSATMVAQARRRFGAELLTGRLTLQRGAVELLPYEAGSFDRIVSVNTIYFWTDPAQAARELRRVLRPGGCLVLAYGSADAMGGVPFTRHGFRLYHAHEVERLLREVGFAAVASQAWGRGRRAFVVSRAAAPADPPID